MKKSLVKVIISAVIFAGVIFTKDIYAATLTVDSGTDTVAVGGEVVVNLASEGADSDDPAIKVSFDKNFLTLTGCDQTYEETEDGIVISAASAKLTFDGKADGITRISAEGAISSDGSVATAEKEISVGTGAAVTKAGSEASRLKTLDITPGSMKPAFSPEVTAYTVDVTEDTELVNVTCSLLDASAKVESASGFKNLKKGTNKASITVKGTDGSTTTYNIAINRGAATETVEAGTSTAPTTDAAPASGDTSTSVGGVDALNVGAAEGSVAEGTPAGETVMPNPDGTISVGGDGIYSTFLIQPSFTAEVPAGFTKESYMYKGNSVESAYSPTGGLRLLYLTAGDGNNAAFRIYYADTDTFYDFYPITGKNGKYIIPIRYEAQEKIPYNYTGTYLPLDYTVIPAYIYTELTGRTVIGSEGEQTEAEIEKALKENETPVDVSELDEEPEFYLIYAMNENGAQGFYLYDIVEDTYQRYVERDTSSDLDESYFKYKRVAHTRFAIMCVLGVLLLIAVFAIINLILKNRELKEEGYDDHAEEEKRKKREERRKERERKAKEEDDVLIPEDKTKVKADAKGGEKRRVKKSERYGALSRASEDDMPLLDLDDLEDDDDLSIPPVRTPRTQIRATGSLQGTGSMTKVPQTTERIPKVTGSIPRTTATASVPRTTGSVPRVTGSIPTQGGNVQRPAGGEQRPVSGAQRPVTGSAAAPSSATRATGSIQRTTAGMSANTGSIRSRSETTSERPPVVTHTGSIYHTNTNIILPETGDDEIKIERPASSRPVTSQSSQKGIARQVTPGNVNANRVDPDIYDIDEETGGTEKKSRSVTGPIREARQIKEQARKTRTVRPNPRRESSFQMINLARESGDILDDDFEFDFLNPDEED